MTTNITSKEKEDYDYSTTFFNREGDNWKVLDIGIKYDLLTKLIVLREYTFIASIEKGLQMIKAFSPDKNVFIDCSVEPVGLIYTDDLSIEYYKVNDFEKSVNELNLALANNKILFDRHCRLAQGDLEDFKYDKKNPGKFRTNRDGFVACLRTAMTYYGGIN